MSGDTITIFDTTLRDGEQSPGCSMTTDEKLEVAKALVELGVDVIEAGFPIASPGDFEAVQRISREFGSQTKICGLARCRKEDIDRAAEALRDAEKARMHVFLATSAIHREHRLKMTKDDIVTAAVEMVKRAKENFDDVEFSPEDAARTELDFLCEVTEKAIEAGATTVNIPDTVGYSTPSHFYNIIRHLKDNVPNIDQAVISTHCHNDLAWPSPTVSPRSKPELARSNARSTAWASGPGTRRLKKSLWRSARAGTTTKLIPISIRRSSSQSADWFPASLA